MKRMACVLALATGTGIAFGAATQSALAEPTPATIAAGLKLTVLPPGAVTADAPTSLDVNFRGGRVQSIELFVDGASKARQTINTADAHGVIHFTLPESLLPEGDHDVVIQATDRDGNTASGSLRIHVGPAEQDALARFMTPKRNAMVKDVLPLEIKLDASIKDPYVAFYIDEQFLSLRNYPPFTYNLDTSKYSNGQHTVRVDVQDGDSVVKTMTMKINIVNPGGQTTRQSIIPDLGQIRTNPTTGDVDAVRAAAQMAEPGIGVTAQVEPGGLARSRGNSSPSFALRYGLEPTRNYSSSRMNGPGRAAHAPNDFMAVALWPVRLADNSLSRSTTPYEPAIRATVPDFGPHINLTSNHAAANAIAAPETHRPGASAAPVHAWTPSLTDGLASPSDLAELSPVPTENTALARTLFRPHHAGNVAARPRFGANSFGSSASVASLPAMPSRDSVRRDPVTVASTPVVGRSMRNGSLKTFDVAFDNTRIAFDVQPRIENGLPLAPFRAIFEHSGGSVKWFNASKTVRAVNDSREIEIHIGDRQATVNNQAVKMEATPYIDHGRTIVPLSFVRDAMDVKVQFDAKTGHLLIESNK